MLILLSPPYISIHVVLLPHPAIYLFMDTPFVENHASEPGAVEQQTTPESQRQSGHISVVLTHATCLSQDGKVPALSVLSKKCWLMGCTELDYLAKTSHESSPTARRTGRNNPEDTGYTCSSEVTNKTLPGKKNKNKSKQIKKD